ncbi:hypothetical protein IF2G_08351 [Cordyceps javanica]|nr:hypothetical protein IF2G_08351 [Cordyceps javanica]
MGILWIRACKWNAPIRMPGQGDLARDDVESIEMVPGASSSTRSVCCFSGRKQGIIDASVFPGARQFWYIDATLGKLAAALSLGERPPDVWFRRSRM